MKKKVLLMGASGSGKTSMRSLIFSNNPASLTSRLGATIDVEQNHVRFLGDLILNLWDCGGQDSFMDSYLSTQRSTIFQHVGVLIYVFEVESRDMPKDLVYYRDCLEALRKYSPQANVFLLVHKMDLVGGDEKGRRAMLEKKGRELRGESGGMEVTVFGTSIYDESLYKAWSRIVHTIIPNAEILTRHLTTFARNCSATEVILFERTTFLVIATSALSPSSTPSSLLASSHPSSVSGSRTLNGNSNGNGNGNGTPSLSSPPSTSLSSSAHNHDPNRTDIDHDSSPSLSHSLSPDLDTDTDTDRDRDKHKLLATRYERTSELIKALKHSCSRVRGDPFHSLEMELPEFTAVLDEMTKNTYVLVIVHDTRIERAALKINIRLARQKFEELQSDSIS
ncbi:uncharacterized protein STEHIDRAFT_153648 [Stereum hirsutum FP-91666 SS1]|uniref:uncharacterized protein n=1 Tax=Stereum hirsutum (strain FP-91666) TaxID=721885 RepID=UPI000440A812|nr:uncharacterized protein STEHIDRAFT_153648 [Stereum hirsutum FP-91666 SS1]EIM89808.1 hypothetical protein STEHIDRAFT_153648 [Stereum hirsutum FP-91666 SS1]